MITDLDWKKYAVAQKREQTGCIPTGFEFLLRAAQVQGIDYAAFQDEFDLDKDGGFPPKNHFGSVAAAVHKRYPFVEFTFENFEGRPGAEKVARIDELLLQKKIVLVSLALEAFQGWHIMPIVEATADTITLLHRVDKQGGLNTLPVKKADIAVAHDSFAGGKEIAYLLKP